jgi:hypothetical protein
MSKLFNNLKQERERRTLDPPNGRLLSQQELAELAEGELGEPMSRDTVVRIERSSRGVTADEKAALEAALFKVPLRTGKRERVVLTLVIDPYGSRRGRKPREGAAGLAAAM